MTFSMSIILYLITGSFAGILAGLLGVGGGAIVVPALAFIFLKNGMPTEQIMHVAIGTSLTAMIFTSFSSTISHHKYNRVDWIAFKRLVPGILIGVIIGAILSTKMPTNVLSIIFAIYLIYISIQMLLKKNKTENQSRKTQEVNNTNFMMTSGGIMIGMLSGLLGIGGGTLTIPLLTHFGRTIYRAIGTSAACGFFITIIGTITFMLLSKNISNLPSGSIGFIYLPAAIGIAITSSICAPIGSRISGKLSPKILTRCFSVLLLVVAAKMLI